MPISPDGSPIAGYGVVQFAAIGISYQWLVRHSAGLIEQRIHKLRRRAIQARRNDLLRLSHDSNGV